MKYFRYLWYPIVLLLGNAGFFLINWDRIPAQVPRQVSFDGMHYSLWSKTAGFTMDLVIIFPLIPLLYIFLRYCDYQARLGIGSRLQKSVLVMILYGAAGISIPVLVMYYRFMEGMTRIGPSLPLLLGSVAVSLLIGYVLLRTDKEPKNDFPLQENAGCWKAFFFYYDPADPKVLVEKRTGLGWTFNYAHKISWVITGVIAAVPVVILALSMIYGH